MTSFYRLLIVITLLLCFSVTTHTHANEKPSEIYVVNTDLLTIRQSPSSSGTIIGTLTQGEKLTIFQHTSVGRKHTSTEWKAGLRLNIFLP